MSDRGVFAVDRGIWTDPDFANEPLSEREAFLWLVSEAAWKACRRRAGSKVVELQRGQVCHSVRFMAQAWQWSKSRVDRFLDRLEKRDTIKRVSGTEPLIVTVCKYDAFQRVSLPERDTRGTLTGTDAGHSRDRLEDIEDIEDRSSSLHSEDLLSAVETRPSKPKPRKHQWPADYREQIWANYPKKVDKKAGIVAVDVLYRSDSVPFEVTLAGIERLISHVDPKFHPSLERWIKKERWNDEYGGTNGARTYDNRSNPTSGHQSRRTGFDAALSGLASLAVSRGLVKPERDADVQPDPGDPGIIDADWSPAGGS